ncbi:MAG: hypothetical protein IT270_11720 [Saprospiraceae bacterium]|nr:hypothetical protein [Saprospiraceae bacterium]
MKTFLLFVFSLCLFAFTARANMASPINEGTLGASPFISTHVEILKENIRIVPDARFETARFYVEYHLNARQSGKQIPLLFYAPEYKDGFTVVLDGKPVNLQNVSDVYPNLETSQLSDFRKLFEMPQGNDMLYLAESPSTGFSFEVTELKFFEIDLPEGEHTVHIEYTANAWVDRGGWVKEYSFRYALSPAKYWKSFGALTVSFEIPPAPVAVTSNLGAPLPGNLASTITWEFDSLPVDVMIFEYKPEISSLAKAMIAISPEYMAVLLFVLITTLHVWMVYRFRKRQNDRRFSWVVLVGSLLVPFFTLIFYMYTYDLIDAAIGSSAGRRHGYTFLVFGLYPFITPVYWLAMWWFDRYFMPEKGTEVTR